VIARSNFDDDAEMREALAAVVVLSWHLRDDTVVLERRTAMVQRPLGEEPKGGSSERALALALSSALKEAIEQVVRGVLPQLDPLPAAPPAARAPSAPVAGARE
jgi:hypothetical protein